MAEKQRLIYWLMDRGGTPPNTSGELNFVLTWVIHQFLRENGWSYQTMNDIVGALDNAKDEFRRRIQHPYEDKKIAENGDVHPDIIL
jgi:hypothetical protein